jgi:hypothetical protein
MRRLFRGEIALGFLLGVLTLLFLIGASSYQVEHCLKTNSGVKTNPSQNILTPATHDEDGNSEEERYYNEHSIPCGVIGFPLAVVQFMDHNEGFFVGLFTAALFFATWRLWLSTNKLWEAGEKQLGIATHTMVAGQRAWLRIDVTASGNPIRFTENDISTYLKIRIINVGTSPAMHIRVLTKLTIAKNYPGGIPAEQRDFCLAATKRYLVGFALFPGEVYPDNILGFIANHHAKIDLSDFGEATLESDGRPISFYIIGCVDYTFPTDEGTHHQTAFMYQISRTDMKPITIKDGDVAAGLWRVFESGIVQGRWVT